jgi:hypothetical protein
MLLLSQLQEDTSYTDTAVLAACTQSNSMAMLQPLLAHRNHTTTGSTESLLALHPFGTQVDMIIWSAASAVLHGCAVLRMLLDELPVRCASKPIRDNTAQAPPLPLGFLLSQLSLAQVSQAQCCWIGCHLWKLAAVTVSACAAHTCLQQQMCTPLAFGRQCKNPATQPVVFVLMALQVCYA